MPDVFGIEGGGAPQRDPAPKGAAASGPSATPTTPTGEGPPGRYMQYDNEVGAMILNLPAHLSEYKAELAEDLMDHFYGDTAGAKDTHESIDAWIANWIEKKAAEKAEQNRR